MSGRYQVVFSEVVGVRGWEPGMHWRAELHDHGTGMGEGWSSLPAAFAYIGGVHPDSFIGPSLDYVHVPPWMRGNVAALRHLIAACRERFPGLWSTDRIDADGRVRGETAAPAGRAG